MAKTILLADDSVTIQKVIELTFMDQDYEVVSASSGEEALAKLDEVTPGLVIADVHMPGATGYEVSRQVKARMPAVPVLLLVGTFEPFDEGEFHNSGADRYLKKPFDSQELLRIVGELESASAAAAAETAAPPAAPTEEDPFADLAPAAPAATAAGAGGFRLDLDDAPAEPTTEAVPAVLDVEEEPAFEIEASHEPVFDVEAEPALDVAAEPAFEIEAEPEMDAVVEAAPAAAPEPEAAAADPAPAEPVAPSSNGLSEEDVQRIATQVAALVGERLVREVAWEVIPDLAEVIIKDRLRELEGQVE
jgi:DNA-binding response OmpR family regulator